MDSNFYGGTHYHLFLTLPGNKKTMNQGKKYHLVYKFYDKIVITFPFGLRLKLGFISSQFADNLKLFIEWKKERNWKWNRSESMT